MRWVRLDQPIPGSAKVPFVAHLIEDIHPSSLLSILVAGAGNWRPMLFAGVVAVMFAVLAVITHLGSSRLVRLCLALITAGALMTLSQYNMLYGVAYILIPMFDKLRESAFWIFLSHLALTCLVGLGVDVFIGRGQIPFERRIPPALGDTGGGLFLFFSFFVCLVREKIYCTRAPFALPYTP